MPVYIENVEIWSSVTHPLLTDLLTDKTICHNSLLLYGQFFALQNPELLSYIAYPAHTACKEAYMAYDMPTFIAKRLKRYADETDGS